MTVDRDDQDREGLRGRSDDSRRQEWTRAPADRNHGNDMTFNGALDGGQSGGGAYANQDDQERGDFDGGQSNQGYYGGGQMGERNLSGRDHSASSTQGGQDRGEKAHDDGSGTDANREGGMKR